MTKSVQFVATYMVPQQANKVMHLGGLFVNEADLRQWFSNQDWLSGCTVLNVLKRGKMELAEAYHASATIASKTYPMDAHFRRVLEA